MRSDIVKKGATRCAHRSLFHADGYGEEDLKKPLVGICNSFNEIIPGHIGLRDITEAAKLGVAAAGGTPIEFPAIGVCDGIAMGHTGMKYSLASRELIADSIEAVTMASGFDALVLIPNCDKVVPGMLMAAARLNIPAVVVSGGPMLPGRFHGRDVSVSQAFEAAGKYAAGDMTDDEMRELEATCCPGCGSCAGLFTANTMNSLTEVLGMGLPGNGTIPAAYLPAASNAWLTLTSRPWKRPGSIGPPATTTAGILSRAAAISMPGTTLSQFGMRTSASNPEAIVTASMESAMSSRLASEYFMPVWPIAMPSQTPMAGNSSGVPPAAATPSFAASAISRRWMWPGMISLKELQMPMSGFLRSSSP